MTKATTAEQRVGSHQEQPKRVGLAIRQDLRNLMVRQGIPARKLLGMLPIRRAIPQDIHSIGDYASGARVMAAGLLAKQKSARMASLGLGVSAIWLASMTDYRLGVLKVIPIEAHEALDYAWGAAAIAAPFVLGYRKRAKTTAMLHIMTGAAHILVSAFTDYRADRGVGHKVAGERVGTAQMG